MEDREDDKDRADRDDRTDRSPTDDEADQSEAADTDAWDMVHSKLIWIWIWIWAIGFVLLKCFLNKKTKEVGLPRFGSMII